MSAVEPLRVRRRPHLFRARPRPLGKTAPRYPPRPRWQASAAAMILSAVTPAGSPAAFATGILARAIHGDETAVAAAGASFAVYPAVLPSQAGTGCLAAAAVAAEVARVVSVLLLPLPPSLFCAFRGGVVDVTVGAAWPAAVDMTVAFVVVAENKAVHPRLTVVVVPVVKVVAVTSFAACVGVIGALLEELRRIIKLVHLSPHVSVFGIRCCCCRCRCRCSPGDVSAPSPLPNGFVDIVVGDERDEVGYCIREVWT